LGRLGIRTIFYLDDILVLGSTFHVCMDNLQKALSLLMETGFIVNWEKSSLIPTTNFTFLGMLWDSVEGPLSLPQDKLQHLHTQAASLLSNPAPTCRQVMVLTGLVAAFHKAVPLLRLKGRLVQLSLNSSYSSVVDLRRTVTLLPEARRDLLWMTQLQISNCHGLLWPLPPSTCQLSILWRIDNTAALAHIRKEGGLRERPLSEGAERILLLAHQRQLRLLPAFIPSEENLQLVPDWHFAPTVFHQMLTVTVRHSYSLEINFEKDWCRVYLPFNALRAGHL
jgi:hypothetical protein